MSYNQFFTAYVDCALWSATTDYGTPLDAVYSVSDFAPETLMQCHAECRAFYDAHQELWQGAYNHPEYSDDELAGHDFWLTRNRHGAGFWDGEIPKALGKTLTDAAHAVGGCGLYVGDDDMLYLS